MNPCPECGSSNIVPGLNLLTDETVNSGMPVYVKTVEPAPPKKPFLWIAAEARSKFQAVVCGDCGYTRLYAKSPGELLDGHRKGFVSDG